MITVPNNLLQKVCSANGGTNSNNWYCSNASEDLVLGYSVADDFFSISKPNEVAFCKDYIQWYDRQFCGQMKDSFNHYIRRFENANLLEIAERNIPEKEFILEILLNALPPETNKTYFRESFIILSESLHDEMKQLAKKIIKPPTDHDYILKKILKFLPQNADANLRRSMTPASKLIFSYYASITTLLILNEDTVTLNEKIQGNCSPEKYESAREVNDYCSGVLANHDTVSLAQISFGSAGGTSVALYWKKIWRGMKWLWNNKGKISKTFRAVASFIDKLTTIWKKENKTKTTKTETPDAKDVNSTAVKPNPKNVQQQLAENSERVRLMDAKLQTEIANLAIEQWNDLAAQKQARFLTGDGEMPKVGKLPSSYILDFIERSNKISGNNDKVTTIILDQSTEHAVDDEIQKPKEELLPTQPNKDTPEQLALTRENALMKELRISRQEAMRIVSEGDFVWKTMAPTARLALFGESADRPSLDFYKHIIKRMREGSFFESVAERDRDRRTRDYKARKPHERGFDFSVKLSKIARR